MAEMTLAEQTGRRLLLGGYAHDPALATIRAWNAAVLAQEAEHD